MKVPFVDLKAQYLSIKEDIDSAIQNVIEQSAFIGGPAIKQFEAAFASYVGSTHCIACGNGTDSIEILLNAMGIGKGDEVIIPAHSWISTSEAVSATGAIPIFVDVDEYYSIDVLLAEKKITDKTKAIIPVHLFGHPADMPAIMQLAEKYKLKVIEDCAQSHGAEINGKRTGTWGHAASFSFYPGKNLGAYGDAGAMLTNDDELAAVSRQIANHGQIKKHHHVDLPIIIDQDNQKDIETGPPGSTYIFHKLNSYFGDPYSGGNYNYELQLLNFIRPDNGMKISFILILIQFL